MSQPYSNADIIPFYLAGNSSASRDRALKAQQQARYVKDLWVVLASIIAVLVILRILARIIACFQDLSPSIVKQDVSNEKGLSDASPKHSSSFTHRLSSAIACGSRIIAFRSTIWLGPGAVLSISEFTFISIYIALTFVFTFIDTRGLTYTFYEDRAAHIASCQISLIVALAGKNNIISWLTGIGHEKLNVLHRASARSVFVLFWVHAMQRYVAGIPAKFAVAANRWMQAGVLSLVALTLAMFLSVRFIRNRFYEFFLVSHIFLIGLFIVGGYIHAKQTHFDNYFWPGLVLWGLDRLLRLARVMWNSRGAPATVELLGLDTIRVTLKRRMTWEAGQHAYLIMPSVSSLPSEAHPFTIASIPEHLDGSHTNDVVFLIRGRSGFTRRLRERATAYDAGQISAFIDGPYGYPPNLNEFNTCVLIAGGSGISYTLPLFMNLVRSVRGGTSRCRRVVFLWCVRDAAHIKWIYPELLKIFANRPSFLGIDARIHITGGTSPSLAASDQEEPESLTGIDAEKKMDELVAFNGIKSEYQRPDIPRILEEEITTSNGKVSVDVAGPASLTSLVRTTLRADFAGPRAVLNGGASVVLHTEIFGMVNH